MNHGRHPLTCEVSELTWEPTLQVLFTVSPLYILFEKSYQRMNDILEDVPRCHPTETRQGAGRSMGVSPASKRECKRGGVSSARQDFRFHRPTSQDIYAQAAPGARIRHVSNVS